MRMAMPTEYIHAAKRRFQWTEARLVSSSNEISSADLATLGKSESPRLIEKGLSGCLVAGSHVGEYL